MNSKNTIQAVDVVCGLAWGDEAKGKITALLAKNGKYSFVCRWAGGNNAGHTIYVQGQKYKTHLIPSGVFYGIPSIVGPGCVVNKAGFQEEMSYLQENGFDTSLVKISPKAHLVTDEHISDDLKKYHQNQGTTARGIAPCYRDKYARTGQRVEDDLFFQQYLWNETLFGRVLCEGAQGFWLDVDYGNYPYVTSSTTLPYGCCSLGFAPQLISKIYGAAKIYDTRSGNDPDFPVSLMDDPELAQIGEIGGEYGVTTGRKRKVNWLNLDKLLQAVNISGTTDLIISKTDVLDQIGIYKLYFQRQLFQFKELILMQEMINQTLYNNCQLLTNIIYSDDPQNVPELELGFDKL